MRPWCFFLSQKKHRRMTMIHDGIAAYLVEPSRWRKTEQKPPLLETKGFFLGAIHKKWNDGPLQKEELVEKHVFAKKYVLGVKCRILSGISIWGGILYGHAGLPLRINLLIIELRIIHPRSTPRKTNMTMENQPIEGVSKRLSHTCLHLMRGTFTFQTKSRDSFVSFLP